MTTRTALCCCLLLLAVPALMAQEPGARRKTYDKALYHEAGLGQLGKASKLYQQVYSDQAAPKQLRAAAMLRHGICLSKLDRQKEADILFERILKQFPDDRDALGRARKELSHFRQQLLPGNLLEQEQQKRIQALILKLGAAGPGTDALKSVSRNLVLIGDPATAQLRRAIRHKDTALRFRAANVLAQLHDPTALPVLQRALQHSRYYQIDESHVRDASLASLCKARPELQPILLRACREERDVERQTRLYNFIVRRLPEKRMFPLVKRLFLEGTSKQALMVIEQRDSFEVLKKRHTALTSRKLQAMWAKVNAKAKLLLIPHIMGLQYDDPASYRKLLRQFTADSEDSATARQAYKTLDDFLIRIDRSGGNEQQDARLVEIYQAHWDDALTALEGHGVSEPLSTITSNWLYRLRGKASDAWGRRILSLLSRVGTDTAAEIMRGVSMEYAQRFALLRQVLALDKVTRLRTLTRKIRFGNSFELIPVYRELCQNDLALKAQVALLMENTLQWSYLMSKQPASFQKPLVARIRQAIEASGKQTHRLNNTIGGYLEYVTDERTRLSLTMSAHGRSGYGSLRKAIRGLILALTLAQRKSKLAELVKHADPDVRLVALKIVFDNDKQDHDRGMLETFVGVGMKDPHLASQLLALETIRRLKDRKFVPQLIEASRSTKHQVRAQSLIIMKELADKSTVPRLIEMLGDMDLNTRNLARAALEEIKRLDEERAKWRRWYEQNKK